MNPARIPNLTTTAIEPMEEEKSPAPPPTISLRHFSLSDIDALMTWLTDDRVGRNMRWETCKNRDEAMVYLRDVILPHPWFRAICVDGGDPVGFVYATRNPGSDACRAELTCSLAHEHWGKGIAVEATRMAAARLFEEWPGVERLEARADVRNEMSQRVLEKAGFQREAVVRRSLFVKGRVLDLVQFCMLRPPRSKI